MLAVILRLSRTMIASKTGYFGYLQNGNCVNLFDRVIITKCKFPKVVWHWQHYIARWVYN